MSSRAEGPGRARSLASDHARGLPLPSAGRDEGAEQLFALTERRRGERRVRASEPG